MSAQPLLLMSMLALVPAERSTGSAQNSCTPNDAVGLFARKLRIAFAILGQCWAMPAAPSTASMMFTPDGRRSIGSAPQLPALEPAVPVAAGVIGDWGPVAQNGLSAAHIVVTGMTSEVAADPAAGADIPREAGCAGAAHATWMSSR